MCVCLLFRLFNFPFLHLALEQKRLTGVEAHTEVLLGLCAVETSSYRAACDHFLKALKMSTTVGMGVRSGETVVFYPR